MDSFQQRRIKEQEALERRFIQIPLEIFYDERLTPCDKIVYGRINTFDEFFESRTHTAELLKVSDKQISRSIKKLLELGYIEFVYNDGRGNRYRATEAPLRELRMRRAEEIRNYPGEPRVWLDKIDASWTNCPKGGTNCPVEGTNCPTEYKESLNEQKDSFEKDKSFSNASVAEDGPLNEQETPKRYGNAEVNDALDLWEHETGFDHHNAKAERYAIAGLIKQHGYEATKALIKRVGIATRSRDRFAPQIAKPSQLRGKYSKFEALVQWERRQDYRDPDQPNLQKLYETPREYAEPQPEDHTTYEQRHANAEAIREQYRGTKYEAIFCRRRTGEGK